MPNYKKVILDKLCYTELVYGRINKKLKINLSKMLTFFYGSAMKIGAFGWVIKAFES